MNVLILTALYPPATGGAATYYGDLISALTARAEIGRVVVLTEQQPGLPALEETACVSVLRRLPRRVSRGKTNRFSHAVTRALTDAFLLTCFRSIARTYAIDVIQFHSRYRGSLTHHALRRAGGAVIADLRDRMLDPRRVAFSDAVLCCAENLCGFARTRGVPEEKLFYVPNPLPQFSTLSLERIRTALARHDAPSNFWLFVGDITPAKGVYELLDGFQGYARQNPNALPLILVGVNREGARFQRRVREIANVRYLGALPREDVLALMCAASAVVLPSKSEGLPTVILEALALGRRVMCPPNVSEFARYCPDWTLPVVSAPAITDFLMRLHSRTDAPVFPMHEFDLPRIAERLVKIYAYVVANRH